ncbi:protein of unknown function [Halopseudomonas xinjiangensis]|uniref:DUF1206 domain-containing protein n=1 Tax=Halopseudomonas xinjiangensis TaxID=487184 RepID=A0A1H1P714_9GAMM|nr:DUF1206 domain-containing protein [Halopseudomonas xinjiangensis]SDS07031.1 protein of unknown function [Halopseudomonas xinjiangensis]
MVDKSEKFSWLVRLGFAARGVVYLLLGYLFLAATGQSQASEGPQGVFDYLQEVPGGTPILYLCALGLVGYALYRLSSLLFDAENYGRDKKGIAQRLGHGASGLAHLVLAYTAFQFAQGNQQSSGGGGGGEAQQATNTILSMEFGAIVVGIVGLCFLGAALAQAKKAISGEFMQRISPRAPGFTKFIGHAGFAARAVVFAVISWSFVQSAWLSSSSQVKTLGEAVSSLRDAGVLFTLVAIGLLLFGVFSLVMAGYRTVPDLDPDGMKPSYRS